MWLDPLSDQLRCGLEGVRAELEAGEFEVAGRCEPALAIFTLPTLIEFVRMPNRRLAEQDAVWFAVIRCYRRRSARLWAPVLLEMLAPAIINEAYRFVLRVPEVDPAEIQQQLLMSALAAAQSVPLRDASGFVKLALVRETRRRVRRWLRRTVRPQEPSLDALAAQRRLLSATDEAAWEVSDLRLSRPAPADLELVTRVGVVGERPQEIAEAQGIPVKTVESRLWRARRRLRKLVAA